LAASLLSSVDLPHPVTGKKVFGRLPVRTQKSIDQSIQWFTNWFHIKRAACWQRIKRVEIAPCKIKIIGNNEFFWHPFLLISIGKPEYLFSEAFVHNVRVFPLFADERFKPYPI